MLRHDGKKRQEEEKSGKKRLLDPKQPREDVTETGGEYAGKHGEPGKNGPDIVHPGPGAQAPGQTTRS